LSFLNIVLKVSFAPFNNSIRWAMNKTFLGFNSFAHIADKNVFPVPVAAIARPHLYPSLIDSSIFLIAVIYLDFGLFSFYWSLYSILLLIENFIRVTTFFVSKMCAYFLIYASVASTVLL